MANGDQYIQRLQQMRQQAQASTPPPSGTTEYAPDPGFSSKQLVYNAEAEDIARTPYAGNGEDPRVRLQATKSILRAEYQRMAEEKADEQARLDGMSTEDLRAELSDMGWEPNA